MAVSKNMELLNNPDVKKEIEQYKWIESEKAGNDIGFEKASSEWLKKFSNSWVESHSAPVKKPVLSSKKK